MRRQPLELLCKVAGQTVERQRRLVEEQTAAVERLEALLARIDAESAAERAVAEGLAQLRSLTAWRAEQRARRRRVAADLVEARAELERRLVLLREQFLEARRYEHLHDRVARQELEEAERRLGQFLDWLGGRRLATGRS